MEQYFSHGEYLYLIVRVGGGLLIITEVCKKIDDDRRELNMEKRAKHHGGKSCFGRTISTVTHPVILFYTRVELKALDILFW